MKEIKIYVSTVGNDCNDGSLKAPFATPQRAVDEVKKILSESTDASIAVYFFAGEYKVNNIDFTKEHSGTQQAPVSYRAYGDGDVIFNGGKLLKNDKFVPVTDKTVLNRIDQTVRDKIRVVDLAAEGVLRSDIGDVYAIGTSSTANQYNDGTVGNNCELFWNNKRMTVARYPNEGFNRITGVVSQGDKSKKIAGTVLIDDDTISRIKKWQEPEKAWIYDIMKFDWGDMSTPIKCIDTEKHELTPLHHSNYGYECYGYLQGGEYYLFNVLEELDSEGEYYIDRDNMLLYIYPPENAKTADALISISTDKMITGNVDNIIFEGIQLKGVRNDVISLNGNNITFKTCKVMNSYGYAIKINGSNNTICDCEIAYLAKGGVYLSGGNRATLTHSDNVVKNNYVHHFGEVFRTYMRGIFISGCGGSVLNNEIAYAPHCVLSYDGNDHVLAYNYIHDAVYDSFDAGALYVGGDWTSCGTQIKYNLFENIGRKGREAKAIYFDDGMSSALVWGNIVYKSYGECIMIGGGRDMVVKNNLFIADVNPFQYDDRMGVDGWASIYNKTKPGGGMWVCLDRVPYTSELWQKRFPLLAHVTTDYNDYLSPDFPANPAYSIVEDNIFIGKRATVENWNLSDDVLKYSTIGRNYFFASTDEALENDTYYIKQSEIEKANMKWEQIPIDKIGRNKN